MQRCSRPQLAVGVTLSPLGECHLTYSPTPEHTHTPRFPSPAVALVFISSGVSSWDRFLRTGNCQKGRGSSFRPPSWRFLWSAGSRFLSALISSRFPRASGGVPLGIRASAPQISGFPEFTRLACARKGRPVCFHRKDYGPKSAQSGLEKKSWVASAPAGSPPQSPARWGCRLSHWGQVTSQLAALHFRNSSNCSCKAVTVIF